MGICETAYQLESRHSPDIECAIAVILNFPASRTVTNVLFINHPAYGILLQATQKD